MIVALKPRAGLETGGAVPGPLGRASHIFHILGAASHHWEGVGPLSIKAFFNGRALYDAGAGHYAVDDRSYLVLNEGQRYSITVEAAPKIESFCVFFQPGFAQEVHRSLINSDSRLLDDPEPARAEAISFFERTYPHDRILSPALFRLRAALAARKDEEGWLQEQLHAIAGRLLAVHRDVRRETTKLPTARASTREELYRRLHRARDYAAALFDQPITLDEMARAACLSPNHFLRTFKQLFQQTPHQYLTRRRLEEAQRLLARSDRPVTDICFSVGFSSLGSFSWLFRRYFGISPEAWRRSSKR